MVLKCVSTHWYIGTPINRMLLNTCMYNLQIILVACYKIEYTYKKWHIYAQININNI